MRRKESSVDGPSSHVVLRLYWHPITGEWGQYRAGPPGSEVSTTVRVRYTFR